MSSTQPIKQPALDPEAKEKKAEALNASPKTTGEKWFSRIRFASGEVVVLGLTAAIAYIASPKYGPDKFGPVPNFLKKTSAWIEKKLLYNKLLPLSEKGEFGAILAGALAGSTILVHGGNMYVPVYKALQDRKGKIVDSVNKRWGKPGELEAGREHLKHQTKETWGDIIKGRFAAWGVVFASFLSADLIAGKDKSGKRRFTRFEESFGELFSKVTKRGREIAKEPNKVLRMELLEENKSFRFGKILALDIYATTAAIALWTAISKFSAIVRGKKKREAREEKAAFSAGKQAGAEEEKILLTTAEPAPAKAVTAEDMSSIKTQSLGDVTPPAVPEKTYASRMGGKPADFRTRAEAEPAEASMTV